MRYDAHMHLWTANASPDNLMKALEKAGMNGGIVLSMPSEQYAGLGGGAPYEERLADVLRFTRKYPDRLYPILWVHPDEEEILAKIEDAAGRGIMGFKLICNSYYIYEDKSMRLLEQIAKTGRPVVCHSGILWDGQVSSAYNKPINWEHCFEISGLRFALAHCSWPWYDECIALYGKFLDTYSKRPELSAEMFLDITPGTPVPYRRDLLTKLHTVGYDVKHNILFGTDGAANDYNEEWARKWQTIDDALYEEIGVDKETVNCIYEDNLKRFLGLEQGAVTHKVTLLDGRVVEVRQQEGISEAQKRE
ncbi:MAG: amidohydrolase family protein [Lachnospiraceae bacterium]|nr:amidohydrolase family protein [Lachnospiraceae bacterium]